MNDITKSEAFAAVDQLTAEVKADDIDPMTRVLLAMVWTKGWEAGALAIRDKAVEIMDEP
jgi:hypothetical protein